MPSLNFFKYQATGNDFIMVDNRKAIFPKSDLILIKKLCDRKFGIGSDGLILIEEHEDVDFSIVFYNPDGSQSLCGNGSRCGVNFANSMNMIIGNETTFMAYDGLHSAIIKDKIVHLSMNNVQNINQLEGTIFVDTGSPHVVKFVDDIEEIDVIEEGSTIRYSDYYKPKGANVNFAQQIGDQQIFVRTYERGVENETLSCGTGVTAAAIAASMEGLNSPIDISTKGGSLSVSFDGKEDGSFTNVFLCGPALSVYEGNIEI